MKHLFIILMTSLFTLSASAQDRYVSVAAFNTQTAMPFGKFTGLFSDQFHPGVEAGYRRDLSSKEHHEWFIELKIACFYHRYVQTGIPVYINFGYRYKINNQFAFDASLGAGYMQSIPATAKLKLNSNGEYVNNKGVGRAQAITTFGLGFNYKVNPSAAKPTTFFATYQQRIQMPFVKSYVPLLPYNSFMIGVRKSIK